MAKEYNIKKDPIQDKSNTKYIVKGLATRVISTEIYKAGVAASNAKGGGATQDSPVKTDTSASNGYTDLRSNLNNKIYADLKVASFDYTIDGIQFVVPEINLASILITVNSAKNIIKTPIQGLNGTIKEYISDSDDSVTFKGRISGKNNVYPYKQVNDLHKLLSAPVAFKVICTFLQNLDIDTVIVETAVIPQEMGGYSYQDFEINCSTDFPIELNIVSASNTTTGTIAMI